MGGYLEILPGLRWGACLPELPSNTVSELLASWRAGDDEALPAVFPLVYNELRRIAHNYLRKERPDHTLQSTALVHEAYLRLEKQGTSQFENREHFLAICAQLMRQILVEHARSRKAAKRDGGYRLSLDDDLAGKTRSVDMVALDDALRELAAQAIRKLDYAILVEGYMDCIAVASIGSRAALSS